MDGNTMRHTSAVIFVLGVLTIGLNGCATSTARPDAIAKLRYGMPLDDAVPLLGNQREHEVLFFNEGSRYRFFTFEAEGTYKYFGFLFKNDQLEAVTKRDTLDVFRDSGVNECVHYPVIPDLNIDQCFKSLIDSLRSARLDLQNYRFDEVDILQKERQAKSNAARDVGPYLFLMVILAPVEVVMSPLIALDVWLGHRLKTKYEKYIDLGKPLTEVDQYLQENAAALQQSRNQESATVIVSSAGLFSRPLIVFGAYKGVVVWIDPKPAADWKWHHPMIPEPHTEPPLGGEKS